MMSKNHLTKGIPPKNNDLLKKGVGNSRDIKNSSESSVVEDVIIYSKVKTDHTAETSHNNTKSKTSDLRGKKANDEMDDDVKHKKSVSREEKTVDTLAFKYQETYEGNNDTYSNDSKPRGLVFMMNFEEMEDTDFDLRKGSQLDFDRLATLFKNMGYIVKDKFCKSGMIKKSQFLDALNQFHEVNHISYDSCIIIIMSYSTNKKTFLTSDGEEIDLSSVYNNFSKSECPSLNGKPKIFILKFCAPRHEHMMELSSPALRIKQLADSIFSELQPKFQNEFEGVRVGPSPSLSSFESSNVEGEAKPSNPGSSISSTSSDRFQFADMYSFHSSGGATAYMKSTSGSLLIEAIFHVFSEHAYKDDLVELGKKVTNYIQKKWMCMDPASMLGTSIRCTRDGLNKKFFFNPIKLDQELLGLDIDD